MDIKEHDIHLFDGQYLHGLACVAANGHQLQPAKSLQMAFDHVLCEGLIFNYDAFDQATLDFRIKDTVKALLLKITSRVYASGYKDSRRSLAFLIRRPLFLDPSFSVWMMSSA